MRSVDLQKETPLPEGSGVERCERRLPAFARSGHRATRLTSADWRSAMRTAPARQASTLRPGEAGYEPPALRGVVDLRAAPFVWPPAWPFEPAWSPLPPRMRCAAALS